MGQQAAQSSTMAKTDRGTQQDKEEEELDDISLDGDEEEFEGSIVGDDWVLFFEAEGDTASPDHTDSPAASTLSLSSDEDNDPANIVPHAEAAQSSVVLQFPKLRMSGSRLMGAAGTKATVGTPPTRGDSIVGLTIDTDMTKTTDKDSPLSPRGYFEVAESVSDLQGDDDSGSGPGGLGRMVEEDDDFSRTRTPAEIADDDADPTSSDLKGPRPRTPSTPGDDEAIESPVFPPFVFPLGQPSSEVASEAPTHAWAPFENQNNQGQGNDNGPEFRPTFSASEPDTTAERQKANHIDDAIGTVSALTGVPEEGSPGEWHTPAHLNTPSESTTAVGKAEMDAGLREDMKDLAARLVELRGIDATSTPAFPAGNPHTIKDEDEDGKIIPQRPSVEALLLNGNATSADHGPSVDDIVQSFPLYGQGLSPTGSGKGDTEAGEELNTQSDQSAMATMTVGTWTEVHGRYKLPSHQWEPTQDDFAPRQASPNVQDNFASPTSLATRALDKEFELDIKATLGEASFHMRTAESMLNDDDDAFHYPMECLIPDCQKELDRVSYELQSVQKQLAQ